MSSPEVGSLPAAPSRYGDDRVDRALAPLIGIEQLLPHEHVARFDEVHRGLQDILAAVEES